MAGRHLSPHGHEVVRRVDLVQYRLLIDFDLSSWGASLCLCLRSVGEACTNSAGGKSMAKTWESIVDRVLEFSAVH